MRLDSFEEVDIFFYVVLLITGNDVSRIITFVKEKVMGTECAQDIEKPLGIWFPSLFPNAQSQFVFLCIDLDRGENLIARWRHLTWLHAHVVV